MRQCWDDYFAVAPPHQASRGSARFDVYLLEATLRRCVIGVALRDYPIFIALSIASTFRRRCSICCATGSASIRTPGQRQVSISNCNIEAHRRLRLIRTTSATRSATFRSAVQGNVHYRGCACW